MGKEELMRRLREAERALATMRRELKSAVDLVEAQRKLIVAQENVASILRKAVESSQRRSSASEIDSEPETFKRLRKAGVKFRAGKPVRWSALKFVCDQKDVKVVSLDTLVAGLREFAPGVPVNRQNIPRDLRSKPNLWEPWTKEGLYRCLWKEEK